jgi:hypothetical protein
VIFASTASALTITLMPEVRTRLSRVRSPDPPSKIGPFFNQTTLQPNHERSFQPSPSQPLARLPGTVLIVRASCSLKCVCDL